MFCKRIKLSTAERDLCEFNSDGVWAWTYPLEDDGVTMRPPWVSKSLPIPQAAAYRMTGPEWLRAENNRIKALRKLKAVRRWKEENQFEGPALK